jgi:hypothetical protein
VISTAYLKLESEAPDVVDKLFSLSYLTGGRHAEIQGWENVMTWPIPIPGFPDIVLAKNGGTLLIGLGNNEDFGKKLTPHGEHEPYLSRDNVMSAIVSPRFLDIAINLADVAVEMSGGEMSDTGEYLYEALTTLRDSFDLICARSFITSDGDNERIFKEDGKIIFKEGSDLLGAYLKLLSMSLLQASAASAETEATIVVRDLYNLQIACLIFYADNGRWPTVNDLDELYDYMDSPLIAGGIYEYVVVGPVFHDENGNPRVNIGLTLTDGTESIRGELEAIAFEAGLLNNAYSLEPYEMDSMTVFFNMR